MDSTLVWGDSSDGLHGLILKAVRLCGCCHSVDQLKVYDEISWDQLVSKFPQVDAASKAHMAASRL